MNNENIAALYTRVSTPEQAESGYSLEEQEIQLKEHCKRLDIKVAGVYSDRGISGKNMKKRPGVTALMVDAEKKKFNMVIVWKLNRISRNQKDSLSIIEKFSENNIEFVSITENLETLTAMGKLHFSIMSGFAEFERNQISENVVMGMNARAREGRWNGGKVIGYDLFKNPATLNRDDDNILIINDKEAELVRYVFQLYSQGNGYKAIANKVNHEGYMTKKGNYFSITSVKDILTNPLFSGMIRYGVRKDSATKKRKGINSNPILVPGIHEAIITKEMFENVQDLIKSKGGKTKRSFTGEYLLTGILRCPECGAGMVAARTVATRKDGTKRYTRYYNCGTFRNKGTEACHANGVRADAVEAVVFRKLNRLMTSEPFLEAVVGKVNEKRKNRILPAVKKIEKLDKEIAKLAKNRETYFKLIESDMLESEMLVVKLREIAERIESLENNKEIEKGYMVLEDDIEVPYELVRSTMDDFEGLMKKVISREEKKTLLHLLIDEIKLGPDRRVEDIVIRFNKIVVEYTKNNGGLPKEGSPLFVYSKLLDLGVYDFKTSI